MASLVRYHPFSDRNKCVGSAAAGILLQCNGVRMIATNDEVEGHTLAIAQALLTTDQINVWLARHPVQVYKRVFPSERLRKSHLTPCQSRPILFTIIFPVSAIPIHIP